MIKRIFIYFFVLLLTACSTTYISKEYEPYDYADDPGFNVHLKLGSLNLSNGKIMLNTRVVKHWRSGIIKKYVEAMPFGGRNKKTQYATVEKHKEETPLHQLESIISLQVRYKNNQKAIDFRYRIINSNKIEITVGDNLLKNFNNPIEVALSIRDGKSSYLVPERANYNYDNVHYNDRVYKWVSIKLNPGATAVLCVNCSGESENFKG